MGSCGCARRGEARAENERSSCFVTGYALARQVKARKKNEQRVAQGTKTTKQGLVGYVGGKGVLVNEGEPVESSWVREVTPLPTASSRLAWRLEGKKMGVRRRAAAVPDLALSCQRALQGFGRQAQNRVVKCQLGKPMTQ